MRTKVMASVLALGLTGAAMAADPQVQAELDALKAPVKQQAAEIQDLRAANGDSWLNQRRAEEIKSLVHEVLSDAETRASLAEGGMTAGWRDHFFLASEDGNFLLRISGQEQIRYIYNRDRDNGHYPGSFNNSASQISLHEDADPKFTYQVSILMSDEDDTG